MVEVALTTKEMEAVRKATTAAEQGNGCRLADLLHDETDVAKHAKILNTMLNLNKEDLHKVELMEKAGQPVEKVKELKRDAKDNIATDGKISITTTTILSGGRPIYTEVWNAEKGVYEDSGSCMGGIVPNFIPRTPEKKP
ncbi:MAG: hypothetical protein K2X81_15860 [Candidatus Obscuribacterales bacterium]|nr:hypothetical protein [Candidatus Obscuribacterales bacterium]